MGRQRQKPAECPGKAGLGQAGARRPEGAVTERRAEGGLGQLCGRGTLPPPRDLGTKPRKGAQMDKREGVEQGYGRGGENGEKESENNTSLRRKSVGRQHPWDQAGKREWSVDPPGAELSGPVQARFPRGSTCGELKVLPPPHHSHPGLSVQGHHWSYLYLGPLGVSLTAAFDLLHPIHGRPEQSRDGNGSHPSSRLTSWAP